MIPAKNLFTGSLGKFQDAGGCRFLSTPHTFQIQPDYSIHTGVRGGFITCSHDGRLWCLGNNFVVLRWNSNSKKLELATVQALPSGESIKAVGIDWVKTQNYFFQAIDEEPYLFVQEYDFNPNVGFGILTSLIPRRCRHNI